MAKKIPKIIHYCWFGGQPIPKETQDFIDGWRKICPDYKIMRWDESNFDYKKYAYTREAYENKKWAFVSDVCRLEKLYKYGGIYIDVNTKVLKSFDDLLGDECFLGFEQDGMIMGALFGAVRRHPFIGKLLTDYYKKEHLIDVSGEINLRTINNRMQEILLKMGMRPDNSRQSLAGIEIYPKEYFCPRYWDSGREDKITKKTRAIHYFGVTWREKTDDSSPLVSVIIPVYNVEKYLRKCLDSAINQTYNNIEIILVDDGSADNSGKICDEYAQNDSRVKVIHQKNAGLNMARATGFEKSHGRWITFLDSDDIFALDNVEASIRGAIQWGVGCVRYRFFGFKTTNDLKNIPVDSFPRLVLTSKRDIFLTQIAGLPGVSDYLSMTVWGGFYRRDFIEKIDWKKSNYRINEDNFWSLQLCDHIENELIMADRLYFYRRSDDTSLSLKLNGNSFNGTPVGFLETTDRIGKAYNNYNTRHRFGLEKDISVWLTNDYRSRLWRLKNAGKLASGDSPEYMAKAIAAVLASDEEIFAERNANLNCAERDLINLRQKLDGIYVSHSWQMTAPLRKIIGHLRRVGK
jgi:glycosyltransferase involved in cell wall biosynthesis